MLPLTFANPADYDKIEPTDNVSIQGLTSFAPGKQLTCVLTKANGSKVKFPLNQSFNAGQIDWFKHGSALNKMAGN
jgi:aconitate hydratase